MRKLTPILLALALATPALARPTLGSGKPVGATRARENRARVTTTRTTYRSARRTTTVVETRTRGNRKAPREMRIALVRR